MAFIILILALFATETFAHTHTIQNQKSPSLQLESAREETLFKNFDAYVRHDLSSFPDKEKYFAGTADKLSDNGESLLTFMDHWYHYLFQLREIIKNTSVFQEVSEDQVEKMKAYYQKAKEHADFMNEKKMSPGLTLPAMAWLGNDDNGILNTVIADYEELMTRRVSYGFRTYLDLCYKSMVYAGESGITIGSIAKPAIVSTGWDEGLISQHVKILQKIFFECRDILHHKTPEEAANMIQPLAKKYADHLDQIKNKKISADFGLLLEHLAIPHPIKIFLNGEGTYDAAQAEQNKAILVNLIMKNESFLRPQSKDLSFAELKCLPEFFHCIRHIVFFITGHY